MNRLQKKCFILSMGAHVLLGVILLVGAAFASRHKDEGEAPPMITMIPTRLIDAQGFGGGNPAVTVAPAPAMATPIAAPPEQPAPPKTEVKPEPKPPEPDPVVSQKAEPKAEPVPEMVKPTHNTKPKIKTIEPSHEDPLADSKDVDKTPPRDSPNSLPKKNSNEKKKREIKVNLTPVKSIGPTPAEIARQARHRAEAAEKQRQALEAYRAAQEQRSTALDNVLARLDKGLSKGTSIEMPGPGGEAFANYGLVVRSVYDSKWEAPADAPENSAKVEIKVIIARDGRIVSSEITRRSNNPSLDKSVQRALNAVRQLPAFPAESNDRERIFIINFDLKAKRQIG